MKKQTFDNAPRSAPPRTASQVASLSEPHMIGDAVSAWTFLQDAFKEVAEIRCGLFGDGIGAVPPPMPDSLKNLVNELSSNSASLVGALRTIKHEISGNDLLFVNKQ